MFKKVVIVASLSIFALTMVRLPTMALGSAAGIGGTTARANQSLLCDIFPFITNIQAFGISSICTGAGAVPEKADLAAQALSLARLGASLIFVAIIIVAVYIVIKAAIKYIRSEGDKDKILDATKAIKSVFIGLIALFIGIIGLVLILVLFEATGALNAPSSEQILDETNIQ